MESPEPFPGFGLSLSLLHMCKYSAIAALLFLFHGFATAASQNVAEEPDSTVVENIVEAINNHDNSTVTVCQPEELNARIKPGNTPDEIASESSAARQATRRVGYRVQVYSDNNVTTAKANAEYRRRVIQQHFEDTHVYISFESPYWRVRVGDYRSQTDAQAAMEEIQGAFPAFAGDCRIVRERINN